MTDECFRAKIWLSRTFDLMSKVEAEQRTLLVLQNKLGSGVRNYDSLGIARDLDSAVRRHEDLLLEFSLQNERIEKTQLLLFQELGRTRNVIERLSKPIYQAIATDRYINNLKWKEIEKNYSYSSSEIYRFHEYLLAEVFEIIAPAIVEPKNDEPIENQIGA